MTLASQKVYWSKSYLKSYLAIAHGHFGYDSQLLLFKISSYFWLMKTLIFTVKDYWMKRCVYCQIEYPIITIMMIDY